MSRNNQEAPTLRDENTMNGISSMKHEDRLRTENKTKRNGARKRFRDYRNAFDWDEEKLEKGKGGGAWSILPLSEREISRKTANSSQLRYFSRLDASIERMDRRNPRLRNRGKRGANMGRERERRGTYLVQIDLLLGIQVRTLEDRIVRVDRIVGPRDTGQNQHH